jgi:hypothetical protein
MTIISKADALRLMAGNRELAARLRMGQAIMEILDRVTAANRLERLRDASGRPILANQAACFRVRWHSLRFIDKLVMRDRKREARRPTVRLIIDE